MENRLKTMLRSVFDVEDSMEQRRRRCNTSANRRNTCLSCRLVDQELSAKFESEIQLEKEMSDSDELPPNLRDFLDSSTFEVQIPWLLLINEAHLYLVA